MRSAALSLLAIVAPACNWVLGIEPTLLVDAGPGSPADGPLPTARLTWMVAVTDPGGNPIATPELVPIVPAPVIMAGPVDGPLAPLVYLPDGTFAVPYEFGASKYRFAYQLPNDLPHEMQWTPTAGRSAHAMVPLAGRLDRAPIPGPSASYSLTPQGGQPAQHVGPRVLTTGIWTESQAAFPVPAGPTFNYNFNSSIQLSGPPGAPESAKGDRVVLVDFATSAPCRAADRAAAFTVDLVDGASTPTSSEIWLNYTFMAVGAGDGPGTRARAALTISPSSVVTARTRIGVTPNATMPAFTERVQSLGLRSPVLLPLVDCTDADIAALPKFGRPNGLRGFELVALHQLTVSRTVASGPTLEGGLSTFVPVAPTGAFTVDFEVAIPTPPFMLGGADVSTSDHTPFPVGTDPVVLTFGVEAGMLADYYDVVLYRITGTSAIAERVYTTATPSVTLDPAVFAVGAEYVFELRAYRGAPDAHLADFTRYLPTQSSAVVWSHTFLAM